MKQHHKCVFGDVCHKAAIKLLADFYINSIHTLLVSMLHIIECPIPMSCLIKAEHKSLKIAYQHICILQLFCCNHIKLPNTYLVRKRQICIYQNQSIASWYPYLSIIFQIGFCVFKSCNKVQLWETSQKSKNNVGNNKTEKNTYSYIRLLWKCTSSATLQKRVSHVMW